MHGVATLCKWAGQHMLFTLTLASFLLTDSVYAYAFIYERGWVAVSCSDDEYAGTGCRICSH